MPLDEIATTHLESNQETSVIPTCSETASVCNPPDVSCRTVAQMEHSSALGFRYSTRRLDGEADSMFQAIRTNQGEILKPESGQEALAASACPVGICDIKVGDYKREKTIVYTSAVTTHRPSAKRPEGDVEAVFDDSKSAAFDSVSQAACLYASIDLMDTKTTFSGSHMARVANLSPTTGLQEKNQYAYINNVHASVDPTAPASPGAVVLAKVVPVSSSTGNDATRYQTEVNKENHEGPQEVQETYVNIGQLQAPELAEPHYVSPRSIVGRSSYSSSYIGHFQRSTSADYQTSNQTLKEEDDPQRKVYVPMLNP